MSKYENDEILYIPEETKSISDIDDFISVNNKYKIKKIVLPDSVRIIYCDGLSNYPNVEEIILNEGLLEIKSYAFSSCPKLKKIHLPKSVETIGQAIFQNCLSLEEITIDKDNPIYSDMGCNCVFNKTHLEVEAGCKNTIIPENTKIIARHAFSKLTNLRAIHIPSSVDLVDEGAFFDCTFSAKNSINSSTYILSLNNEFLNNADIYYEDETLTLNNIASYGMGYSGLVLKTLDGSYYFADNHLNLTRITKAEIDRVSTPQNELTKTKIEHISKLYEWLKCDKLPHRSVVENMPVCEIPNFYINNNRKNWQTLIKYIDEKSYRAISVAFTFAHALGVFSTNGKESKEATHYIIDNLFELYDTNTLCKLARDFSCNIKYNPEFAKFFMYNFDGKSFLKYKIPDTDETISLIGTCYNNFSQIQKTYPEKRVITRQNNDRLTPEIVISILTHKDYSNVDERAKNLAHKVGLYGYSQHQYDQLQEWYLQGLNDKCLFSHLVDGDYPIQYEVLEKSDPLGSVLGSITNCCQVVDATGSHCVEYGMSQPNSTFVVFRTNDRIIGQGWIWYDKTKGQITLDNIEVPHSMLDDITNGTIKEHNIVSCLNRLAQALNDDFINNGHPLKRITIGLGYNDFNEILTNNFKIDKNPQLLSGYDYYTDATKQVVLLEQPVKQKALCDSLER